GSGEGLAKNKLPGQAQLETHTADFILEELPKRLHQFQVHHFRQPSHIVMALDHRRGPLHRDRLDHVRIRGPLDQETRVADLATFLLENPYELLADDLSLLLGIEHAPQSMQKPLGSIDADSVQVSFRLQYRKYLFELVFPKQAVVDEDANQPVTDGPVNQQGGYRRVDAP